MHNMPSDLGVGGSELWAGVSAEHVLDAGQLAMLGAACRMRDRADALGSAASGGEASALRHERESVLAMTRLLVALRLPDAKGVRAAARPARGAYAKAASSRDRLKAV